MPFIVPFLRLRRRHAFWKKLGTYFFFRRKSKQKELCLCQIDIQGTSIWRFTLLLQMLIYCFPLPRGCYVFCSCRKVTKRARIRAPTVLLIITPLCRRIVSKAWHKRIFEPLTPSTWKNAFHSLRQYLECDFFFGNASRVLLYFRLYCSPANLF